MKSFDMFFTDVVLIQYIESWRWKYEKDQWTGHVPENRGASEGILIKKYVFARSFLILYIYEDYLIWHSIKGKDSVDFCIFFTTSGSGVEDRFHWVWSQIGLCTPHLNPHLRQLCLAAACLQIFALFLLTSISLFLLTSISLFLFRSISLFLLTSISLILVYNYLQVEVQSLGIESAKVSFQFLLYIFTNCQCELSSEHTWYLTLGGVDFNLFNTSFIFYFWTLGGVDFIFLSTPGGMDFAYISQ